MKLLAHVAAAMLTNATYGGSGGQLPPDPEIKDQTIRARNLTVWELHRIYYHAIVGACKDSGWPEPDAALGGPVLQDLAKSLLPLVTGGGGLTEVLSKLIGAIPIPAPKPNLPAALPNPGEVKP